MAVGCGQRVELTELGAEAGVSGSGGTGQERFRRRAEAAELFLRRGSGPDRPPRFRPGATVVLVDDGRLTRGDRGVVGHDLPGAGVHDQHPARAGDDVHARADQGHRDRVAGRPDPHAGQLVDLTHDRGGADPQLQRRQRAQQQPFLGQALRRDRDDLRVHRRVDLGAPRLGGLVAAVRVELVVQQQRGEQVGFGVPDQVLHDPLRLGVGGFTEVWPETVMHCEPDIFGCRDNPVRHDATLQAAHPVGQHDLRYPAHLSEALAQHRQRRSGLLIGGEPHEPPPRPSQHRTEHVDPALGAPVNDQVLTRGPDRRAAAPVVLGPPVFLGLGDQAAEVPGRPFVPGGACRGQ